MSSVSRGERWFWWLAGVAALVGTLWWYSRFVLPRPILTGPALGLLALVAVVVAIVRWRDRERTAAARAVERERAFWDSTLPTTSESRPSGTRDAAT